MESTWGLANFLWGSLIVGMIIFIIHEARKSPEQKKREAENARGRY